MPSIPRRHHVVPRFYLRHFAKNDQLLTLRLPDERTFPISVNDATVRTDFYSDLERSPYLKPAETMLADVEGEASKVITRLADGQWRLSFPDRRWLVLFVSLQLVRGTEVYEQMAHSSETGEELLIGEHRDLRVARDALPSGQFTSDFRQAVGPIFEALLDRPLLFYFFNEDTLLTSDSPVSLGGYSLIEDDDSPGLTAYSAQYISMPLTRRIGLLFGNDTVLRDSQLLDVPYGACDEKREGSVERAEWFNRATYGSAYRNILSHPDDSQTLRKYTLSQNGDGADKSH